jgi:hypothetical protein
MSFLPEFENDVFISYSHVDNLGEEVWVERFHQQLEVALARRVGRMGLVTIWRDKRLEGNQLFDNAIRTAIKKTAVFVAITSNGYLASDYCRQELGWFHEKAQAEPFGLQVGDRSRIYNVLLTGVPPKRWPPEYGRISGYRFHDGDADDDPGEPTDPDLDRARYKQQLSALAESMFKMLLAFKERMDADAPAPAEPPAMPGDGPAVFVAEVADSLRAVRKRLVAELTRKGVSVHSGVPPPYDAEGHQQRVSELTAQAALSVHLLDHFPGREIDGDAGRSYPQSQVEIVRGRSRPQLIWVPKALEVSTVEDEEYGKFLAQLEHGERAGASYDFVRGTSPTLVPQVLEKLAQQTRAATPAGSGSAILLDTHLKDQIYALELGKLLLEYNIQPYINPQEDDPGKNLDTFEARLAQVSSLVIVYGHVTENWVRQRLGVALQLSVIKKLALKSFCVLLVPPEKQDHAVGFSLGPVPVRLIDNSHSTTVSRSVLEPLLVSASLGGAV